VQESLLMTAELRGIKGEDKRQKIVRAIQAVGLQGKLTSPIANLSKGFRQRVGLAQAILHQPDILILDEPTNGLDPEQIVEVRHLIRELASHATVILSTHILSEVEQTCERVLVLMEGRLRADARLADLKATNRYRVSFESSIPAQAIHLELEKQEGLRLVQVEDPPAERISLLVEGPSHLDLGALLFEQAKQQNWPLRELRPDVRSLESVFQQLRSGQEVRL
jgi:ABC-2 type transport system ATP-binding protein